VELGWLEGKPPLPVPGEMPPALPQRLGLPALGLPAATKIGQVIEGGFNKASGRWKRGAGPSATFAFIFAISMVMVDWPLARLIGRF
jgi:hypothetical protein